MRQFVRSFVKKVTRIVWDFATRQKDIIRMMFLPRICWDLSALTIKDLRALSRRWTNLSKAKSPSLFCILTRNPARFWTQFLCVTAIKATDARRFS